MELTVDDIAKLLQSGGNLALMIGIYFGNRILRHIKAFVDSITEIRENVAHVRKLIDSDLYPIDTGSPANSMPTEHPSNAIRRFRLRR